MEKLKKEDSSMKQRFIEFMKGYDWLIIAGIISALVLIESGWNGNELEIVKVEIVALFLPLFVVLAYQNTRNRKLFWKGQLFAEERSLRKFLWNWKRGLSRRGIWDKGIHNKNYFLGDDWIWRKDRMLPMIHFTKGVPSSSNDIAFDRSEGTFTYNKYDDEKKVLSYRQKLNILQNLQSILQSTNYKDVLKEED